MLSSRQKSCLACVRSKRRCDQGSPKCRRCLARKVDCEYIGRHLDQLPQIAGSSGDQDVGLAEPFVESLAEGIPGGLQQLQRSPGLTATGLLPNTNDNLTFLNVGNDPFIFPSLSSNEFLSPSVIEDIVSQQDPEDIGRIPSDARHQARVEFTAKRLAAIPRTFAQQVQTMFIHRLQFQYSNSPGLQDALSTCALYSLKNADNQALVFRVLELKPQQLIASTDPLVASKTDLLAALQALLLYQMIRLFDGDIRLRARAEADEPALIAWAWQLNSRMHQVVPSLPASSEVLFAPQDYTADWLDWLVEESSRRTVLTVFILKGVYDYLKLGYDKVPNMQMSFTAQAALWNSQSKYSWRRACSERERLEVRITHWDEDMARAVPSDLEELGVLLMGMLWGIETTEQWMGESYFAKYGLGGVKDDLT